MALACFAAAYPVPVSDRAPVDMNVRLSGSRYQWRWGVTLEMPLDLSLLPAVPPPAARDRGAPSSAPRRVPGRARSSTALRHALVNAADIACRPVTMRG